MRALAVNVALLRKRTGITQQQLAERVGVGKTTVNNIETGYLTAPVPKIIEALASAFDTTTDGLLGKEPLVIGERACMIYIVSSMDARSPLVEYDRVIGSVFVDRDILHGYEHFALKINDNSMANRRIICGDVAIVRKGAPLKNNDIVVAAVAGIKDVIVRTYFKNKDKIILKAENDSDIYKDITLCADDNSLKLIGKVIKCEFDL